MDKFLLDDYLKKSSIFTKQAQVIRGLQTGEPPKSGIIQDSLIQVIYELGDLILVLFVWWLPVCCIILNPFVILNNAKFLG